MKVKKIMIVRWYELGVICGVLGIIFNSLVGFMGLICFAAFYLLRYKGYKYPNET